MKNASHALAHLPYIPLEDLMREVSARAFRDRYARGREVTMLRKALGWSQKDMCSRFGVSSPHASQAEHGRRDAMAKRLILKLKSVTESKK